MSESNFTLPYPFDVSALPATWIVAYIKDLAVDVRNGFASGRHSPDPDSGTPHLRPMNISTEGKLVFDKLLYVPIDQDIHTERGDILFNNTNSAALVGKTAPVDVDGQFAFSNHMTRLKMPEGLSHRFFAYQLHYLWETGYFKYRSTQHINQASISSTTLARTVPLVVAPQLEQLRIAAEIDSRIDRYQAIGAAIARARAMLEEYRSRVLAAATAGTLLVAAADGPDVQLPTFDTEEAGQYLAPEPETAPLLTPDEPTLPSNWRWARVDAVGELKLGRMRSPATEKGDHMRPHLRVANVFEDKIDLTNVKVNYLNFPPEEFEIYRLRAGDILLNEGQSPELVGRPAMFHGQPADMCFQNTLIRFRTRLGISAGFALLVFRHYFRSGRFTKIARWTTNLAHLGFGRFAALPFPVPPLAEQERIVAEVQQRFAVADELEESFSRLTNHLALARQATLHQAFTGALLPQLADEESASNLLVTLQEQQQSQHEQQMNKKPRTRPTTRHAEQALPLTPATAGRTVARRPLLDILAEHGGEMTPEELYEASGFIEEEIEQFYDELRAAKHNHLIAERKGAAKRTLVRIEVP